MNGPQRTKISALIPSRFGQHVGGWPITWASFPNGILHGQILQRLENWILEPYAEVSWRCWRSLGRGQLQPMNLEVGRGLLGRNSYAAPSLCLSFIICSMSELAQINSGHINTNHYSHYSKHTTNGSAKDLPTSIWISACSSTWCFLQKQGDSRALW